MKHYAFSYNTVVAVLCKRTFFRYSSDDPAHPAVQIQEEGINFFIEGDDEWFFDGHNLSVTLNEGDDFPQFNYENKKRGFCHAFYFLNSSYFAYHSGYNFLNDTGRNPSFSHKYSLCLQ